MIPKNMDEYMVYAGKGPLGEAVMTIIGRSVPYKL